MKTNFFTALSTLAKGKFILTIDNTIEAEKLIVTLVYKQEDCTDPDLHTIPPQTIRASAEKIDDEFFDRVGQPVKEIAETYDNSRNVAKQLEAIRKEQAEKLKEQKQKASSKPNKKPESLSPEIDANVTDVELQKAEDEIAFEERMVEVNQLAAKGSPRQAYAKMPSVKEFPRFQENIEKRKEELYKMFSEETKQSSFNF